MNIRNSLVTYHLNIDEANRGDRVAQRVVADLLLTESVKYQNKTHKQAGMNWLCKWAERGQVSDMLDVAKRFEAGRDVPSSLPEAFKWYLKAANNQNAEAMFKVGEAYEQGKGVGIDFDEAEDWFEKARDKGYSEAVVKFERLSFRRLEAGANTPAKMVELGKKYEMVRDYAKAFAWYSKAAEADDKDGCYEVGMMYKYGLGVTSSSNGERTWFAKAKKLGHLKAEKELGSRGW
jgi:TPR repeat protein